MECGLVGADKERPAGSRQPAARTFYPLRMNHSPTRRSQASSITGPTNLLGSSDPFEALKKQGNQEALAVCKEIRPTLHTFRDYVLASVIGNTFDYGVKGHTVTDNFSVFLKEEFAKGPRYR